MGSNRILHPSGGETVTRAAPQSRYAVVRDGRRKRYFLGRAGRDHTASQWAGRTPGNEEGKSRSCACDCRGRAAPGCRPQERGLSFSASAVAASSSSWSSSGLSLSVSAHQSWVSCLSSASTASLASFLRDSKYVDDALRHCLVVEVAELFLGLRRRTSPTSAGLLAFLT